MWAGVFDGNPELALFWLESGALFRPEFGVLHNTLLWEVKLDCVGQPVGRHGLVDWMERAVLWYRGTAQELAWKLPGGLVVNWQKWEVVLLEFTRAWDAGPDYRLEVKARKTARYVPILDRVLARLGAVWKGQTLCFTTGVRGSLHEADWVDSLEALGVPSNARTCIMKAAVNATVDVCAEICRKGWVFCEPQP